ncbi:MAG: hypothetical protein IPP87_24700 [Ideonella sp.]|nr:hypothetical protein [Ideonella sp.]MBL0151683.1 hypothetical protein [Ideonella sp.]
MDKNTLVPIALFVCMTYSLKLLVDARMRYLFLKGNTPEAVTTLLRGEEHLRRMGALRWGVILSAMAVGLGLVEALGWQSVTPGAVAVVLATAGAGNFIAFALTRRYGLGPEV